MCIRLSTYENRVALYKPKTAFIWFEFPYDVVLRILPGKVLSDVAFLCIYGCTLHNTKIHIKIYPIVNYTANNTRVYVHHLFCRRCGDYSLSFHRLYEYRNTAVNSILLFVNRVFYFVECTRCDLLFIRKGDNTPYVVHEPFPVYCVPVIVYGDNAQWKYIRRVSYANNRSLTHRTTM